MHDPDSFDFFVSYARADNATGWITRFVEELLAEHRTFAAGRELHPFFDEHAITTGADWRHYLARGVARSKLFLAFISPAYLASEWCRKEWRAWIDAEIARHILTAGVRPVYIVEVPGLTGSGQLSDTALAESLAAFFALEDPAKAKLLAEVPPVLANLRRRQLSANRPYPDLRAFLDAGRDALRLADLRQTLAALARDLDHHAALLARAEASLSTIPAYNKNFTGRIEELLTLRERLVKDDRTGVIYGVHGLGGIGKTELAFAYAHAYASAYPGGRFLVRCEGRPTLREAVLAQSDFTVLFQNEITPEQRMRPDDYFAALADCLRNRLARLGHILLVLDNVTDLDLLAPAQTHALTLLGPSLHLLATTRLVPPAAGCGHWLALGRLPDPDALDLLEKFRPFTTDAACPELVERERAAAARIVKRLGGFTLAVELVAAWLAKHPEVTCAGFLERLGIEDTEALDALAEERDAALRRHNDERRLAAVLDPTLAALPPAAARAMEFAALLPPDHLALPWLRALLAAEFPELAAPPRPGHPDPWATLLARLTGLTLFLRPETETSEPRLLTVHRLVQDRVRRRTPPADLAARQQAIDSLLEERNLALQNTVLWEDARWELDPFEALAWLWAEPAPSPPPDSAPPAHPGAAWLLNQAAGRRHHLADFSHAEPLMRSALAIDEAALGKDHPAVAVRLNNLAALLQDTNRPAEAEPLMRQALAIDEAAYGKDHPEVAIDLNNLAGLLMATNRLAEAEPLMRRGLVIEEKSKGRDHPHVAIQLNDLALLLRATNRLAEAEPLMRRALAIDEVAFGRDHPDVARDLNNLAQLLQDTNRLAEAEPIMRRGLAIEEKSKGSDHPHVAIQLNNLAQLLQDTNRLAEAEPLCRRALAIDEAAFGKDHPKVAIRLNNLAGLYYVTNHLAEAGLLMRRVIEISLRFTRDTGHRHPDLLMYVENYRRLLTETGRTEAQADEEITALAAEYGVSA